MVEFDLSVPLIQVGNNRNDYFRYVLGVRLIKVSFKVNNGNKYWDFGYCPLNRGCPLNTGFTVVKLAKRKRCYDNDLVVICERKSNQNSHSTHLL